MSDIKIVQVSGLEAYNLIYEDHLVQLAPGNQEIMRQAIAGATKVWLGFKDDKVLCVWGLIAPTLLSDQAYLWIYTTEYMKEHVFGFVRHSQRAVEEMLKLYPTICGHSISGDAKSIRWLKWLGAEFHEPIDNILSFEIKARHG